MGALQLKYLLHRTPNLEALMPHINVEVSRLRKPRLAAYFMCAHCVNTYIPTALPGISLCKDKEDSIRMIKCDVWYCKQYCEYTLYFTPT